LKCTYDRQNEKKKNPENHIVGFLMNLFTNYGGKYVQTNKISGSHRPVTSSLRGSSVLRESESERALKYTC
jgi:hypothetical protein